MDPGGTGAREAASQPDAAGGAPAGIASRPGAIRGYDTRVTIPGSGRSYAAHYEVNELEATNASHSGINFQPNPNYGLVNERDYTKADNQSTVLNWSMPNQFQERELINDSPNSLTGPTTTYNDDALAGNGRHMTLERVYATNPKGAQAYKDTLADAAAHYGIDPEALQLMKKPELRRVIDEDLPPEDLGNAIADFNKKGTKALRPSEQAISDSRRVSQDTLDDIARRLDMAPGASLSQILTGKDGAAVLSKLIDDGVITEQDRAQYAEGDTLTKEGKDRIGKLMVGRFFRDPAQLDSISSAAMREKLERIAAPLARVESDPDWNLTPRVQAAIDLLEQSRKTGIKNLDVLMKQGGLFFEQNYPPDAVAIAKRLSKGSGPQLGFALQQYAADAGRAAQGPDMFGGETPDPRASFDNAFVKQIPKPPTAAQEYAQMLKNWKTDPAALPDARGGPPISNAKGKLPRTFPASQLPALAAREGITPAEARTKLLQGGWLVTEGTK